MPQNKTENPKHKMTTYFLHCYSKYILSVRRISKFSHKFQMLYVREGVQEQEKDERRKTKIKSVPIAKPEIYLNTGVSAQSFVPLCFHHKANIVMLSRVLLLPLCLCLKMGVCGWETDRQETSVKASNHICRQLHWIPPSLWKRELCWGRWKKRGFWRRGNKIP